MTGTASLDIKSRVCYIAVLYVNMSRWNIKSYYSDIVKTSAVFIDITEIRKCIIGFNQPHNKKKKYVFIRNNENLLALHHDTINWLHPTKAVCRNTHYSPLKLNHCPLFNSSSNIFTLCFAHCIHTFILYYILKTSN